MSRGSNGWDSHPHPWKGCQISLGSYQAIKLETLLSLTHAYTHTHTQWSANERVIKDMCKKGKAISSDAWKNRLNNDEQFYYQKLLNWPLVQFWIVQVTYIHIRSLPRLFQQTPKRLENFSSRRLNVLKIFQQINFIIINLGSYYKSSIEKKV